MGIYDKGENLILSRQVSLTIILYEGFMFKEICKEMEDRSKIWIHSMCASPDEVRICWLICEVERLQKLVAHNH